jgi:hypothetical protein
MKVRCMVCGRLFSFPKPVPAQLPHHPRWDAPSQSCPGFSWKLLQILAD